MALFRGLGQRQMEPRRAWIRQAWLQQARRALSFQREWLEMMRERIEIIDQNLATEIEEEAELRRPHRRSQQATRPLAQAPRESRRAALQAVFGEMPQEDFLQDGRPRVESVNERLRARGIEAGASRNEIDEAFEIWKNRQQSNSSC
jgi:hypothetical protein